MRFIGMFAEPWSGACMVAATLCTVERCGHSVGVWLPSHVGSAMNSVAGVLADAIPAVYGRGFAVTMWVAQLSLGQVCPVSPRVIC